MFYSILLAGGLSSRMGQDKGALDVRGETLLIRAIRLLESIGSEKVLLSGSLNGHKCIPDLVPQAGPLGGIYSSLDWLKKNAALDNSLILIIPVDMPSLNQTALLRLVEQAEATEEKCCHYVGEVFPCVLRASEEVYEYLQQAFSENTAFGEKRSMKNLMKKLSSKEICAEGFSEEVFMNINRPEDWQVFMAQEMSGK